MPIDPNMRKELMEQLLNKTLKGSKSSYNRKIFLWELTVSLSHFLKRLVDILASLLGMILLSPVFIITSLAIYLENPGPVFYASTRVGKDGREFSFYKFRSMVVGADKMKEQLMDQNESSAGVIFKMKRDPRITRSGNFIRRFSIDEMPQLLNVLLGDMSLVGPGLPFQVK